MNTLSIALPLYRRSAAGNNVVNVTVLMQTMKDLPKTLGTSSIVILHTNGNKLQRLIGNLCMDRNSVLNENQTKNSELPWRNSYYKVHLQKWLNCCISLVSLFFSPPGSLQDWCYSSQNGLHNAFGRAGFNVAGRGGPLYSSLPLLFWAFFIRIAWQYFVQIATSMQQHGFMRLVLFDAAHTQSLKLYTLDSLYINYYIDFSGHLPVTQ